MVAREAFNEKYILEYFAWMKWDILSASASDSVEILKNSKCYISVSWSAESISSYSQ